MGTKMSSAGKVLAASFAGAGLAAVAFAKKSSDQFRKYGMEVGKLSRYTGASVEESSKLAVAFQQSGISAEAGTKAIGIFSKKIVASKDTMKDFGVKTRDASGQIRPMSKILEDAADKIAGTKNATEKLALAQKMFGKGGADMVKVLGKGADGMRELEAEATKYGLVLTEDNMAAVKAATDAARDQELAYQGLQVQIGQYVTPAITKMTTIIASEIPKATGFIDDHHAAMATLGGAVTSVVGLFLIYKAAVIAQTVAMGAATTVTATYKFATMALSTSLDVAATSAYAAAGAMGAIALAAGSAAVAGGALWLAWKSDAHRAANQAKDLADNVKVLSGIMKEQGVTVGVALREFLPEKYVAMGDKMDLLGLSAKKLNELVRGSHDDWEKWRLATLRTQEALGDPRIGRAVKDVENVRSAYVGLTPAAKKAADAAIKAAGGVDDTADAADKAAPKVKTLAEKWDDVASAVDDASDKLKTIYGLTTDGIEGRIEATAAMMEFTAGLKENGTAFNENSKAGQDNYKNIIAARDAAVDYADSLLRGGKISEAATYMADYSKVLEQQAVASGVSKEKAAELIETLGLTPEQIVTYIKMSGYKEAKQAAIDLTNNANAAAAKRFLNWVADNKDPVKKAKELKKIADDAAAKRYIDWVAHTATPKEKADQLKIAADEAARKRTLQINVNGAQEAILAMQGIQTQKNLIDDPVTISVGLSYAGAVGAEGLLALGIDIPGDGIGKLASGSMSAPRGLTWVGENGPELMSLAGGETIYTAGRSAGMMARGGTAVMDRPIVVENYVYLDGKQIEGTVRSHAQDREARTGKAWTA
jgi:hypothetical protein